MKKKSVNIKGKKYTIEYVSNFSDKFGNGVDGICDLEKCKIYIDASLSEERKFHVMLHEVMHGLFNENSFSQAIPRSMEELICDQTAALMMDLFFGKKKQFK